ncbi:MAG: Glycosyl transferase [uncultured Campylobacterales bacterium]|uniref:Glycosyl transferase n=1 Tax=uncultured Campylobacterales bacterium TaxID=352960 RepID=A0A6S6TCB5_9BACT|nr:MAG: Glycosyl transferase [uncultured Campylobacterales bacterium]
MNNPLISIITVVYNDKVGIKRTIKSVLNQTYKNIEYVIVDGNSNDGTLDIIKKYQDSIDFWMSENDEGIYDAMNKGIQSAKGDFIQFLNAGDIFYEDDSLLKLVSTIDEKEKVYFGRAHTYNKDVAWVFPSVENTSSWLSRGNLPNHQAMLFPKNFYENNFYNLSYKISSDKDYKIRAYKKVKFSFCDIVFVKFELDGVSNQYRKIKNVTKIMKENFLINKSHKLYKNMILDSVKLFIKMILAFLVPNKTNSFIKAIKGYKS